MSGKGERVCAECGEPIVGRGRNAVYCAACKYARALAQSRTNSRAWRAAKQLESGEREKVGHTIDEAALFFGCSRETVRTTEKRALAKLRKALEALGITSLGDILP